MTKNKILRKLCRKYLNKLRFIAQKRGLEGWLNEMISETHRKDCEPTEYETQMLARLVNEERIKRDEIPPMLGKTLTDCHNDENFEHIKKLPVVGTYSRVSAILYASGVKQQKTKKYKYAK